LTFGGFEGESKLEMYNQLPDGSYPKTIFVSQGSSFEELQNKLITAGLQYPIAVKPDVGMMGFLFRKIRNADELKSYHFKMPVDYLVQTLVNYPVEVSVFYYRFPGTAEGNITGFIRKEFLQVTGDGQSTLLELLNAHPRARLKLEEMKLKHRDSLSSVIPKGVNYVLSMALNLSRGGKLVSLEKEKDRNLVRVFDDISHHAKHFYYGRYDIKTSSINDLKNGKNFLILEFNGSGAEPHHVYGNGNTLLEAYRILISHWKILFEISRSNHKIGYRYWNFVKGYKFLKNAKKHFKVLKQLDVEMPVSNN
jgi:hypothetical protein